MLYLNDNEDRAVKAFTAQIKKDLNINLTDIKLFGSKSTGRYSENSDIDVLLIVKTRDESVLDIVSEILIDVELEFNARISPVVLTIEEYNKDIECNTSFYLDILREGVSI
jgi:uncharacterized protein